MSIEHARIVQLAATLAAALLVAWVWSTNATRASRAAVLTAGTLIAVPYALLYDLTIAAIAGAWLIRAGRDSGFLRWEKPLLATVYLMPLFAFQAGLASHLPLGAARRRYWCCCVDYALCRNVKGEEDITRQRMVGARGHC